MHIVYTTCLVCQIAVTTQCHFIALNSNNAMKHISFRSNLSKHSITNMYRLWFAQYRLVASVLKERAHTYTTQPKCYGMSSIEHTYNLGYKKFVVYFFLLYLCVGSRLCHSEVSLSSFFLLNCYCVVACSCGILVWQTMQHINRRNCFDKFYNSVVSVSKYHLVPFH